MKTYASVVLPLLIILLSFSKTHQIDLGDHGDGRAHDHGASLLDGSLQEELLNSRIVNFHDPGQVTIVKQYVCSPCGNDCDKQVYDKPGNCAHCGMALIDKATIGFTDISFEAVCARLKANPKAVLLDVRSAAEFKGTSTDVPSFGHLKNAINVNINELESRIGELNKFKDQEVIVYCSHSHRSPRASYFLSTHGFKNVKNVAGGVSTLSTVPACLDKIYVKHAH